MAFDVNSHGIEHLKYDGTIATHLQYFDLVLLKEANQWVYRFHLLGWMSEIWILPMFREEFNIIF